MYVSHVPPATGPASAGPVGVDASWRLPDRLRPAVGDLPALAWLIARRFTGGPHEGDVGRCRAAASLPLWLALLVVQHATGTLAARGRDALVVLTPTWPAARGPYRLVKAAAFAGVVLLAPVVGVAAVVLLWALGAAGLALGAPRPAVVLAQLVSPALVLLVWLAAVVAHPCRRVLAAEVRRWATGRHAAVTPEGRIVLATTLFGRGRPSIAAARLGRDVLDLADGRGWALLTNGGVPGHTAAQYSRVGFDWLPDSTRRMLRPATRPGLVDVAVQRAAALAGRARVRLDEVRLVDAPSARAGRARGRAFVNVPAQYLCGRDLSGDLSGGAVPGYARAAIAHEVGHHALGHFTARTRLHRVGPKAATWVVLVLAGGFGVAATHQPALVAVAAPVTLAGVVAAGWLCDRPVRRQEYDADAFAVGLVGVDDVVVQLRRLRDRAGADGPWFQKLQRALGSTHPPVGRRLERVLSCPGPTGSAR